MKKQKSLLILIPLLLLTMGATLTSSCAEQTEVPTQIIEDVSAQEALNLIQENKSDPDFIIVDVRTSAEYAEGHIENAINIDFSSVSFKSEISKRDRAKKYLIYCRSGNRSRGALDIMVELDFIEVYHLYEGIIGWSAAHYPVVK